MTFPRRAGRPNGALGAHVAVDGIVQPALTAEIVAFRLSLANR